MRVKNFVKVKNNLLALGYRVQIFDTASEAADYLNTQIDHETVGFAGSMTLEKMGLYDSLKTHNEVFWHHRIPEGKTAHELRMAANSAKVYLSSVNALSENGEIVNIDATGNRVASIFYGHERVYLLIGENKIEPDYDSALYRARNVAAPLNAKRLGKKTPCAVKADKCYNCNSPDRICRALSVLWEKPMTADIEVLLIHENLGY
jgi:hypothetical protein